MESLDFSIRQMREVELGFGLSGSAIWCAMVTTHAQLAIFGEMSSRLWTSTRPTPMRTECTMSEQKSPTESTERGVFVGPPPRQRIVHRAKLINPNGGVSPLCAKTPRALDLRRATWVLRDDAVTCLRCLKLIEEAARAKVT